MLTRHSFTFGVLVVVLAGSTWLGGQPPPVTPPPAGTPEAAPPGRGRGGRGGGAVRSGEVAADGRVTFRLRAPSAQGVAVTMAGGRRFDMKKDEQGVWSVTTDPLKPDYYTYSLVVDGNSINDPGNRTVQTGFGNFQSMVVIPGPDPWLPGNVPHGAIARHRFQSAVANDDRDFFVYTPPGYDPRRARAYPVLYLLHGLGDDAERWMNGGGAPAIMDNLIAQGKAVPMVVVTTLGYGVSNGPAGDFSEIVTGYTKILLTEVIPTVEKAYNVSTKREDRAIAGLSMGGAETLYTALNNPDKFAWMGSFSGAFVMWPGGPGRRGAGPGGAAPPPIDDSRFEKNFPNLDARINSKMRLIWIVCGTADSLIGVNRQFKAWLTAKGVQFTYEEVPDVGHVWPLWRQNLTTFAQKVFQPKGK
jgi:enterochelin esterase family protein